MLRFLIASRHLDLGLRLLLAGVFVYAAVPKLLHPSDFEVIIAGYGLTPFWLDPVLAVFIPVLELVLAVLLVLNRSGAVTGSMLLLAGFSMLLGYGIHLGLDVDCGCFGPDDPEGEAYHGLREALYRDVFLLGCCAWLALRRLIIHKDQPPKSGGVHQTA